MPTPIETLQAIRDSADVNIAALDSVAAQAEQHLADVELWPSAPSKGFMRDQLRRLRGCFERTKKCAETSSDMATRTIALLGADPGPGPAPPPTGWSTGEW